MDEAIVQPDPYIHILRVSGIFRKYSHLSHVSLGGRLCHNSAISRMMRSFEVVTYRYLHYLDCHMFHSRKSDPVYSIKLGFVLLTNIFSL